MMMNKEISTDSTNMLDREERVRETLCELIAYLIANVVKSEKEWREWGQPFLEYAYISQFGKEDGELRAKEIEGRFFPIVGHGLAVWMEEETERENEGDKREERKGESFMVVSSSAERITVLLQGLGERGNDGQ